MSDPRPIGVFDSGVGGLTVLRELQEQLPAESTIYFGDLGHFPYGPRYQAQVRNFALNIIRFLEKLDVKLVVIACNTATAAALNTAREVFDIPIIGVITPGAEAAVAATKNKKVGVISTEGTLKSQEYLHAIREANPTIEVLPKAAPRLVDLVEAGKSDAPETEAVLRDDLQEIKDFGADTLILGCTHYPLLSPMIKRILGEGVTVVDSAQTTAARVGRVLAKNGLECSDHETPRHQIYVTGSPDRFHKTARILFGQDVPPITTVRMELVEAQSGREGAA
ncbi:MAG TPA: glutamate racemase [Candidatus Dormibacteraeota bacterium]|jgi:glutamate racemase|nr:glutamate racemase [Candidatus Dormibacteraeota bacterium]